MGLRLAYSDGREVDAHRCPRCEQVKPLTYFYKDKTTSYGHSAHCKSCKHDARRQRTHDRNGARERLIAEGYRKKCNVCDVEKPLQEFGKRRAALDGSRKECQSCAYDRMKKWLAKNRDRVRRYRRTTHLKRNFGLSTATFELLLDSQGHACAICRKPFRGSRYASVDHDHRTNQIRGLLCQQCNLAIGNAFEDTEILKSAISYLKKYEDLR